MKRLIDEFAEKVRNTTSSFMIEKDEKYYFFVQCNVGTARYIYSDYSWDKNFYSNLELKLKLIAITVDGKIYIVDEFSLGIYKYTGYEEITLPENVYRLSEIICQENEKVCNVIFPEFYNKLEECNITEEREIDSCKRTARQLLFAKETNSNKIILSPMFNEQDIANSLCGIINLAEEANKRFMEEKDEWVYKKSFNKKVQEYIDNKSVVEDYELEIAAGLRSVDAKTVTIEFELNGKTASAKIEPNRIRMKLENEDYFSSYDFEIAKRGEELIKYLDAGIWRGRDKEVLTCKHITKITYGKKDLYVRS